MLRPNAGPAGPKDALMASYRIHGLDVASARDLAPLPRGASSARPDVVVHFAVRPSGAARARTRCDDADDPWVHETWLSNGHIEVDFVDGATFELTSSGVWVVDEGDDPDLMVHQLLDHVIPRVVALRGDLMLHAAGALDADGSAHVFVGATGAGKSTLSVVLAEHGWGFLDDDGIRLERSARGWLAYPGYASARLLPDAAEVVCPTRPLGRPMALDHAKRHVAIEAVNAAGRARGSGPRPLRSVYVIERGGAPRRIRLRFADAISALVEHTFSIHADPDLITRRVFEQCADVAASAAVYRLIVPPSLGRLHEVVDDLDAATATSDAR